MKWFVFALVMAVALCGAGEVKAQVVGGSCSGSATAGPDATGNLLKCNGSTWYQTLSGPATAVFKAAQPYVNANTGWPANGAAFKMTKQINTTSSYNASTGAFTAPVAGYYVLSFAVAAQQASSTGLNDIQLAVNGTGNENVFPAMSQTFDSTNYWSVFSYSGPVYLNAGDTASVLKGCCSGSGTVVSWRGYFTGYFLHP